MTDGFNGTLTEKQRQILAQVLRGNADGSFCTMDELATALPYTPSKQALQFSIRFLHRRNLLDFYYENRGGRRRRVIAPTLLTYSVVGPSSKNIISMPA